jgi:hypothetical protein
MTDQEAGTFTSSDPAGDQNDHAGDREDHAGDQDDHAGDREDHAGDQDDHARDHGDREGDIAQGDSPYRQFAENYPDPNGDGPLQVWPLRRRTEFDSEDDFWRYIKALDRWKEGLPPPNPLPGRNEIAGGVPQPSPPRSGRYRRALKSSHVGIRLTERDYELLADLARAHSVALGTMARMLVVRGVRAAARETKRSRTSKPDD